MLTLCWSDDFCIWLAREIMNDSVVSRRDVFKWFQHHVRCRAKVELLIEVVGLLCSPSWEQSGHDQVIRCPSEDFTPEKVLPLPSGLQAANTIREKGLFF